MNPDPLHVPDDEPWAVPIEARHRSRDVLLLAFAGCVILVLLAVVWR